MSEGAKFSVPKMGDLYEQYRSHGWLIAKERIGQELRERYELSEALPPRLLALLGKLDAQSDDLALAASRVTRGHIIVAAQQKRIARLKALGCPTFDYERTLRIFEDTLEIFLDCERNVRDVNSQIQQRWAR